MNIKSVTRQRVNKKKAKKNIYENSATSRHHARTRKKRLHRQIILYTAQLSIARINIHKRAYIYTHVYEPARCVIRVRARHFSPTINHKKKKKNARFRVNFAARRLYQTIPNCPVKSSAKNGL